MRPLRTFRRLLAALLVGWRGGGRWGSRCGIRLRERFGRQQRQKRQDRHHSMGRREFSHRQMLVGFSPVQLKLVQS